MTSQDIKIYKIIREWKNECCVVEPILFSYDYRSNELNIYTNRPGILIGYHGEIINRYRPMLKGILICMKEIKFIETSGFVL